MPVTALDALLAIKAIALLPGLTSTERRIAAGLIDHYNRRGGGSFPSIDRLSRELCIDRRTVLRGTQKLHQLEIISRDRYQGRHRTNSYEPNWRKLIDYQATWRRSTDWRTVAEESVGQRADCHSKDGVTVTQTYSSNLHTEPVVADSVANHASPKGSEILRKGQARRPWNDGHSPSQRSITSVEAASQAAIQRWDADVRGHFRDRRDLLEALTAAIDKKRLAEITAAEVKRRGGGLSYVVEHLSEWLPAWRSRAHG